MRFPTAAHGAAAVSCCLLLAAFPAAAADLLNDVTPPQVLASVAVPSLAPANGSMVNVGLAATAIDDVSGTMVQVAVFSDEPESAGRGNDRAPDVANVGPGTLELRAERDPRGDGRVYLIAVTAFDESSNMTTEWLAVTVPRNRSDNAEAAVEAEATAAIAQAAAAGAPPAGWSYLGGYGQE